MKLISYIENTEELAIYRQCGVGELIISPKMLSRFGEASLEHCHKLARECREAGIKTVLEWDILMVENIFRTLEETLCSIDWDLFDSVRVQDPGALEYVLREHNSKKVQLILETGNHNLEGIRSWIALAGDNLERVVLSLEITASKLERYIRELSVDIELLALGRILLLYTPRHLLTPLAQEGEWAGEASADSEEGGHKKLPVLENRHGTFLFNSRDRCILDALPELKEMGLAVARVDCRFGRDHNLLPKIVALLENHSTEEVQEIKQSWPVPIHQGFFRTNRTNALFKKLKNQETIRAGSDYLGEVLEVKKPEYIAMVVRSPNLKLQKNCRLKIHTTTGQQKTMTATKISNSGLQEIDSAGMGEVVLIPHISGVSIRSSVYLD